MSFRESLKRLSKCLGQDLEVAPEKTPTEGDWSDGCPNHAVPGGYGPGRYGPGNWDPCTESVSHPNCKGAPPPFVLDSCPCDRNLGITEYFECCRNHQPPISPPLGFGSPWDGDCNNPPHEKITCYRDTRNDPPETHGWHCCKDDKHIWPGNPDYEYGSLVAAGQVTAQVPDPPKPPGGGPSIKPRPVGRPGRPGQFGWPPIINPGTGPEVYENPCAGKNTNGKICCRRIQGHRQTRWRGYTRNKCLNPDYARYISECQGQDGGGGGSSG